MRYILGHLIISHLKFQNSTILRLTSLAIDIVAFETSGFVADPVTLWDKLVSRRRKHKSMAHL